MKRILVDKNGKDVCNKIVKVKKVFLLIELNREFVLEKKKNFREKMYFENQKLIQEKKMLLILII